jgi:branched-chain amino acid transport system substrate-binding protein
VRPRTLAVIVAATAFAVTMTACSSSNKADSSPSTNAGSTGGASSSSSSSSGAAGTPIKIGVLTDSTGVASSGFTTTEKGIKAYVDSVNADGGVNGQKITYVMGDTASTPAGALTAAQKLVQSDKVFAIVEVSSDFFGAEPYLLKQGVPVIGGAFDGPEWTVQSNTNLFSSIGVTDFNTVSSVNGEYMKMRGVTNCGSMGYSSSKTAQASAIAGNKSCVAAGLKATYLNNQIPFGSTDMGAIALAIKAAGVDGMMVPVVPATAFALAAALKQIGVKLKSYLLLTGYGGDLLASSAAVAAGQGYEFSSVGQPIEANTPATQKFAAALAKVGVTGPPTFAEQHAYIGMAAFVAGLKAAGANPSQKAFLTAMRGVKGFDGDGLLSPAKIDFDNYAAGGTGGSVIANCIFVAELNGTKFTPVSGTPLCGKTLPGLTTG